MSIFLGNFTRVNAMPVETLGKHTETNKEPADSYHYCRL